MECTVKINMNNAAFIDQERYELSRIFLELSKWVYDNGYTGKIIKDINGNTVGKMEIK